MCPCSTASGFGLRVYGFQSWMVRSRPAEASCFAVELQSKVYTPRFGAPCAPSPRTRVVLGFLAEMPSVTRFAFLVRRPSSSPILTVPSRDEEMQKLRSG